jgi:hypothetical protein
VDDQLGAFDAVIGAEHQRLTKERPLQAVTCPNLRIPMTSLVLELQHEAMDPEVRVDALLRKAVVVATTLGIDDFRVWAGKAPRLCW